MKETEIFRIFQKFGQMRALVIGDAMVDSYLLGMSGRISPEAKVPVIALTGRDQRAGGAANVVMNLHNLGAQSILFTVTGDDEKGNVLKKILQNSELSVQGLVTDNKRITTVKYRIISNGKHMARIDEEITTPISAEKEETLISAIRYELKHKKTDVILFVDYDKGVITPHLFTAINDLAIKMGIPVAVDPKSRNFNLYRNVTLFKPNLSEFLGGTGNTIDPENLSSVTKIASAFRARQNTEMLLITMAESGALISSLKSEIFCRALPRNITDVTGAGDTCMSVASLTLAAGLKEEKIVKLSNLAGGLVCESPGICAIDKYRMMEEMRELN